jgi:hypothetical protein
MHWEIVPVHASPQRAPDCTDPTEQPVPFRHPECGDSCLVCSSLLLLGGSMRHHAQPLLADIS